MNALRFVIEGKGAYTIVDGKNCLMEEGDLVITPGWTWHEHVHKGDGPDRVARCARRSAAPLSRHRRVRARPGPRRAGLRRRRRLRDAEHRAGDGRRRRGRSRRCSAIRGRRPPRPSRAAPTGKDGARRVRYVNPLTGGSGDGADGLLPDADRRSTETIPYRTTSNAVCCVVEGSGTTPRRRRHADLGPEGHLQPAARQLDHPPRRRATRRRCSW